MKLKSVFNLALLSLALFAGHASAAPTCTLGVSRSYVPISTDGTDPNSNFSFSVSVTGNFIPGPLPPYDYPYYTAVFYGTKNGVNDIPYGYTHPYGFSYYGTSTLSGYGNRGNVSGNYMRYALIYSGNWLVCVTNAVYTTLQ